MRFNNVAVLLFCAAVMLTGCASFRNNEIADAGKLPDVSQYKNKPSVYVDYHFLRGEPGSPGSESPHDRTKAGAVITECLEKSSLFSRYSFNEADKATTDFTLKVDIYNHGNTVLASVAGFVSGYTLGIVPAAATDNYTLEVKLIDKAGTTVSSLSRKDSVTTWVGLWFIPVMSNTPDKAVAGTLDNQLRTILKELVESSTLKYSLFRTNNLPAPV